MRQTLRGASRLGPANGSNTAGRQAPGDNQASGNWASLAPSLSDLPVYDVTAAARLAGMHPQTLRQYDRLGLVVPQRTPGRRRSYSVRDVATLREVQRLSAEEGINLAGIARILNLERQVRELRLQVETLRAAAGPARRFFVVTSAGDAESLPRGRRSGRTRQAQAGGALVVWRASAS